MWDALDPETPDVERAAVSVTRRVCGRLGLGAKAEEDVAFLVRDRHLLDDAARRLDPLDEETVLGLAARIADPDRARMLYLLTVAASPAGHDAPAVWWRGLLDELTDRVLRALAQPH